MQDSLFGLLLARLVALEMRVAELCEEVRDLRAQLHEASMK